MARILSRLEWRSNVAGEPVSIGTPVEIDTASNTTAGTTSLVLTVGPSGVPAGVTIFVDAVYDGALDTAHVCADNVNGAYVVDVVPTEVTVGINARRFRFSNNAALVENDTITLTWSGGSESEAARAFYVQGLDLASPLTGTPTGTEGNSSTADPADSGALTTTDADAIILSFLGRRGFIADGYTEDSDFTTLGSPVAASTGIGGTSRVLHTAYRIVSATETQNYAPTTGVGRNWAAGISAYKAAPSANGVWSDITTEVFRDPVRWTRGLSGILPGDRVGAPGTLEATLKNRDGSFTPGHANADPAWQQGVALRLNLRVEGNDTLHTADDDPILTADNDPLAAWMFADRFVWRGTVRAITPEPGVTSSIPAATVVASDYLADLLDVALADVVLRENVRSDDLVRDVIAEAPRQPVNTDLDIAQGIAPFAFDDLGEGPSAIEVLQAIAQTELGFAYLRGGASGEVLRFEQRNRRGLIQTSQASLFPADLFNSVETISAPAALSDVINDAEVVTVPRRTSDSATDILIKLDNALPVDSGATETIFIDYRDPANVAEFVGGKDMIALVANTDYTANTEADGSGTNITSDVTIVSTFFGSRAMLEITNANAAQAFVRGPSGEPGLQGRGRGIFRFRPVAQVSENTESLARFGRRELSAFIMPYEEDSNVGRDVADLIVALYGGLLRFPQAVRIRSEWVPALADHGVHRDVGDLVAISEPHLAVNSVGVIIHSVSQELGIQTNRLSTTWTLAPAPTTLVQGWLLEIVGRSELGETTFLGA